jgi:hypothetical protein
MSSNNGISQEAIYDLDGPNIIQNQECERHNGTGDLCQVRRVRFCEQRRVRAPVAVNKLITANGIAAAGSARALSCF